MLKREFATKLKEDISIDVLTFYGGTYPRLNLLNAGCFDFPFSFSLYYISYVNLLRVSER
jgi:hypothetical protein